MTQKKCMKDFGGKSRSKRLPERTRHGWDDNIEMDLRERRWSGIWFRIGTSGGLL
jgi:hypothetical protein